MIAGHLVAECHECRRKTPLPADRCSNCGAIFPAYINVRVAL